MCTRTTVVLAYAITEATEKPRKAAKAARPRLHRTENPWCPHCCRCCCGCRVYSKQCACFQLSRVWSTQFWVFIRYVYAHNGSSGIRHHRSYRETTKGCEGCASAPSQNGKPLVPPLLSLLLWVPGVGVWGVLPRHRRQVTLYRQHGRHIQMPPTTTLVEAHAAS